MRTASTSATATIEREGKFMPLKPRPGTVLVNVGYLLMRWSNGRWKNVVHRVVAPPAVGDLDKDETAPERYGIAFFSNPDSAAMIDPFPSCYDQTNPKRWKPINAGEFIQKKRVASQLS
ncbi:MAG: hypothetical protein M1822_008451 [Bathelium mastoideum]|nr:MAG: hypothetical protein M1822_008451 [Bathelium mastoideum]